MPKLLLIIDREGWRFFLREGRQTFPLAAFAPEADILPDDLRDRQALFELRDEQLEVLIWVLAAGAVALVHRRESTPNSAARLVDKSRNLWVKRKIAAA